MSNEKTFLEKQREEQILKVKIEENAIKWKQRGALGFMLLLAFVGPLFTLFALNTLGAPVDINIFTYLAMLWIHFVIKDGVGIR